MAGQSNEAQLVALALGILVPVAFFGLIATISLPLVLAADVAMLLFLRQLWRKYRQGPGPDRAAHSISAS